MHEGVPIGVWVNFPAPRFFFSAHILTQREGVCDEKRIAYSWLGGEAGHSDGGGVAVTS